MLTFIAIYHGTTVGTAELVAVSADPTLVSEVATRLLDEPPLSADAVRIALDGGRRRALRLIRQEAGDDATC